MSSSWFKYALESISRYKVFHQGSMSKKILSNLGEKSYDFKIDSTKAVPKSANHESFINKTCVGSSHVFIYKNFARGNFRTGLLYKGSEKMGLKEKLMQDKIVIATLLVGTCLNLYYCMTQNWFSNWALTFSKLFLIVVPYVAYLLLLFMPKFRPEKVYSFTQTRKLRIVMVFFLNLIIAFGLSRGAHQNLPQILAILFSVFICLFGNHLVRIKKSNEMWGLQTPWTGNSIEHLYRTNQFGGRLLNFVGIVSIISSFYISPLFASCLILAAMISIYMFSYFLSKKM